MLHLFESKSSEYKYTDNTVIQYTDFIILISVMAQETNKENWMLHAGTGLTNSNID